MEISDILQEFDTTNIENNSFTNDEFGQKAEDRPTGERDLQALTRAWVNERATANLLSWPHDGLIGRCCTRIKDQIDLIERMTGNMDPKTNFTLIIIQTDVERWKFMIRSYLRARLAKIHKYTLHYLSPENKFRLSEQESAYAYQYQQLLHQHYLNSFLRNYPTNLQNLTDTAGGISMVEGPDEQASVFVRGLGSKNKNKNKNKNGDIVHIMGKGRNEDGEIGVATGEVVLAKWSDVRGFIELGEMELV